MRAVFLDRDGVICLNRPDYVKSWGEFVFYEQARESLARLAQLDMPIVIITNQSAINRGLVPVDAVEEIHRRMLLEVESTGGRIDSVYYCPHRPDEGCDCRKPRAGLLRRAAAEMDIELKGSYLVGDAWTDIKAGLDAGCDSILVLTGRGQTQVKQALLEAPGNFRIAGDLAEAVGMILYAEGRTQSETAGNARMSYSRTRRSESFSRGFDR
jgi:D-glycero-D-manno-heptose 1,7-bisphosphate phosphatase